jgi:hypothetical protein
MRSAKEAKGRDTRIATDQYEVQVIQIRTLGIGEQRVNSNQPGKIR